MRRKSTPFDLMQPALLATRMMIEAQTVIALRLWGMAGALPMRRDEPARMVAEKTSAMQEAGFAVAKAAMAGATPAGVAMAGLKPVRRRTRANVKRLIKPL